MNKLILIFLFLVNSIGYSQKINEHQLEMYQYNDSTSLLDIYLGVNGLDTNYSIDSSILKYSNLEGISILLQLDNNSNLIIKDGILPRFKSLYALNVQLSTGNKGKFYLPSDLNKCLNLESVLFCTSSFGNGEKSMVNQVAEIPKLKFFGLCLDGRCGNRKLIKSVKWLMRNSETLETVNVYFHSKQFKGLIKYGNKYGIKVNEGQQRHKLRSK